MLEPETDMKVKHGVIGLLRHLAYASKAREPLGKVGIIGRLIASNIFKENSAIAGLVQVNAIGIAKHLCSSNGDHPRMLFLSNGVLITCWFISCCFISRELLRSVILITRSRFRAKRS